MQETNFENDIRQCLTALHNGGTILYPTDTIWGIGCDATNATAVARVAAIKQRPDYKSFVILVADERDILQYTASPDLAVLQYLEEAQKPTTVIYEHALGLANNAVAADGSIAIRICKDPFCRHLIKRFGKPLVSTSANISGAASPAWYGEVDALVINAVDYVVQHRSDDKTVAAPSSIIKWENGMPFIIRP